MSGNVFDMMGAARSSGLRGLGASGAAGWPSVVGASVPPIVSLVGSSALRYGTGIRSAGNRRISAIRSTARISIDAAGPPRLSVFGRAPLVALRPRVARLAYSPARTGLGELGTSLTINGIGQLNAGLIARQVALRTGLPTTAGDIIGRIISLRGTNPYEAASVDDANTNLVKAFVNAGSPTEALEAVRPLLEPLYRELGPSIANGKLFSLIDVAIEIGIAEEIGKAALDIGEALFSSVGGSNLISMIGEYLGNSEWLRSVAEVVSTAASTVAKAIPYIGMAFRFANSLADFITSLIGIPIGETVAGTDERWANYSARLYAALAIREGYSIPEPNRWRGVWSPFFQETFVLCNDMMSLDYVRAMDVHQFRLFDGTELPKWRDIFSSASAHEFAATNASGIELPPTANAERVLGVCRTFDATKAPVPPVRWDRNSAAFRASVVGACFLCGSVNGIKGFGTYDRSIAAECDEDMIHCYRDANTRFYMLGQPFGRPHANPGPDYGDPRVAKWWSVWGGYFPGWRSGVLLKAPSGFPYRNRDEFAAWQTANRCAHAACRNPFYRILINPGGWLTLAEARAHPALSLEGTAMIEDYDGSRLNGEKKSPKWSTTKKVVVAGAAVGVPVGGYFLGRALRWWK